MRLLAQGHPAARLLTHLHALRSFNGHALLALTVGREGLALHSGCGECAMTAAAPGRCKRPLTAATARRGECMSTPAAVRSSECRPGASAAAMPSSATATRRLRMRIAAATAAAVPVAATRSGRSRGRDRQCGDSRGEE